MKLDFQATKKQWEAIKILFDSETTELWYWWWAWWWKSYIGVFWIWAMCQKYPQTRWFFGRKELQNLKRTTLNTYFKFLVDYNIPEANKWNLNNQTNTIVFKNWSEILLLDMARQPSDPLYTRFGSLELTGWFIDESNEIQDACINIIKTRLWRQNNSKYWLSPKLLETFNPDKWHVYQRYYKPRKSWTLPTYRKFIPALATDNPHLDELYIQQLKRADEITRQRLLLGNFEYDDTPWKLFRYDEVVDLFTNNIEISNIHYITADIARLGNDKTVIIIWRWREAIKIISYNWLTTDQTAIKIKELEQEYKVSRYKIAIDSDWVGGWVADQLRWCVNFINNGRATEIDDIKNNFANQKTQCYFKLKELMERREIRVSADWQIRDDLSQELDNILVKNIWTDQKIQLESKDEMKLRIGRSPDYADALMMRMYFEINSTGSNQKTDVIVVNYDSELY